MQDLQARVATGDPAAVEDVIALLDAGKLRVAEKVDGT